MLGVFGCFLIAFILSDVYIGGSDGSLWPPGDSSELEWAFACSPYGAAALPHIAVCVLHEV